MARREFLKLLTSSSALGVLGACAASPSIAATPPTSNMPLPTQKIRAICFDLFTLFDPHSVDRVARTILPEQAAELCDAWRVRQFEYSWLRAASRQYRDFAAVTEEALRYAVRA